MNPPGDDKKQKPNFSKRGGFKRNWGEALAKAADRRAGIDETAEIDLPERDDEARVDRQQQHEIEFAGADVFGDLGAVGQEERLENLLNKMARAHQQHDLPFRPIANPIRVLVNHG